MYDATHNTKETQFSRGTNKTLTQNVYGKKNKGFLKYKEKHLI